MAASRAADVKSDYRHRKSVKIGIDVEVREKNMQMEHDVVIGSLGGHPINIHPKTRLNPSRVNLAILLRVLDTVVRT